MGLTVDRIALNMLSFSDLNIFSDWGFLDSKVELSTLSKDYIKFQKESMFAPSDKNIGKHNLVLIGGDSEAFTDAIGVYKELCNSCRQMNKEFLFPFLPKLLDTYIIQIDGGTDTVYFFVKWVGSDSMSITVSVKSNKTNGKRKNIANILYSFMEFSKNAYSVKTGCVFYNVDWISPIAKENCAKQEEFKADEFVSTDSKYAIWVYRNISIISCYVFVSGTDVQTEHRDSIKMKSDMQNKEVGKSFKKNGTIKVSSGRKRVVYDYSEKTVRRQYSAHKQSWFVRGYFQHFGKPGNQVVKYVEPRINVRKSKDGESPKVNKYIVE